MLRAVLLGLVVVSASACSTSSTETSAKVTPGAAAGKVLETKGSVTVKQGDATRPLAVGETVLSDDVVITGADGNVVIELAHNSARWELGPNKQTKVSESVAWKANKATPQEITEASAAAGRPAERSAAGTVASAENDEEAKRDTADPETAMAPSQGAPAPGSAPEPDMTSKGSSPPRPPRQVATTPKTSPPPPVESTRRKTRGGGSVETHKSAAPADSLSGVGAGGGGNSTGTRNSGARTESSAPSPLAAKSSALHACMVDHGAKDNVTLTVDVVNGKATVKLASKGTISAALDKCLKGVVSGIHFTGSATLEQTVKP